MIPLALLVGCAADVFPGRTYICALDDTLFLSNIGPLRAEEVLNGRTSRCGVYATGEDLVNGRGVYDNVVSAEFWEQQNLQVEWGPSTEDQPSATTLSIPGIQIISTEAGYLKQRPDFTEISCESCEIRLREEINLQIKDLGEDVTIFACSSQGSVAGEPDTVLYTTGGDWSLTNRGTAYVDSSFLSGGTNWSVTTAVENPACSW